MTDEPREIDEAELHAFVDRRLDPRRQGAVEAYLAAHPDEARRFADFQVLNEGLHALYDDVLSEKVPDRLHQRRRPSTLPRWRILAPALALAAGVLLGWFGRDLVTGTAETFSHSLVQDAIAAHLLYAPDSDHPLEVSAGQHGRLLSWLKFRLGDEVVPPDLSQFGYELLGARAMPSPGGPAVQLSYRDPKGAWITLMIVRVASSRNMASIVHESDDGLTAMVWIDDGFACTVVGPTNATNLRSAAESVYRQLTSA